MTLSIRSVVKFPADVVAGDGIAIAKSGATFTFSVAPNFMPSFDVPFEAGEILVADDTNSVSAIAKSSTVGQVLRVIGDGSYQWGALNLADGDAVVGVLPTANGGAGTGMSGHVLTGNGVGVESTYQGFTQSGTGAITRTWQEKGRELVHFKDFGVVGDGVTDDYLSVKKCIDYAVANGRAVHTGEGAFVLNMSGGRTTISLSNVSIIGAGAREWLDADSPAGSGGTWFLIKGAAASPFTMSRNVTITGCTFFYPDQTSPNSLMGYPTTLAGAGGGTPIHCRIEANTFINAMSCIDLATGGFNEVRANRFCSFGAAVTSTFSHAETEIVDNFFSYGYGQSFYNSLGVGSTFLSVFQASSIGVFLNGGNNADATYSYDAWTIAGNTFFAQLCAIFGTKLGGESFFWGNISHNHFDAVRRGIYFENKCRPGIADIAGNTFNNQGNGTADPTLGHITIATTGAAGMTVVVTGNLFGVSKGDHIVLSAANACDVTISGNNFTGPGNGEVSAACIALNAAICDATITGNNFSGVYQGGGINIDALVVQAARLIAFKGNTIKGTNVAINNVGTIANNLIISGNNHLNVNVPVVSGAVLGTLLNALNSWNATLQLSGLAMKLPPWQGGYKAGRYYIGAPGGGISAGSALSANTVYFYPLVVGETHTFDRIAVDVTTAGTAANMRLAIYSAVNGTPASLVLDAGSTATSGTGLKSTTISQSLVPGVYFLALVLDGTNTYSSVGGPTAGLVNFTGSSVTFSVPDSQVTASMAFGAYPATAFSGAMGAASYGTAATPIVGLRA